MKMTETSTGNEALVRRVVDAVILLDNLTTGSFDIWCLAGQYNAKTRARLHSELAGEKKTQAQSGVNSLIGVFHEALGVEGRCMADRQKDFASKCRELLAGQSAVSSGHGEFRDVSNDNWSPREG